MDEISFDVPGHPPLKGEARSVFSATHGQAERIRTLLQAAQFACQEQGFTPVELDTNVALTVIARSPLGDAANIIGGIADVLEDKPSKSYRSAIDHLGDLAAVSLYRNDSQIKQVDYREEPGGPSYTVTIRKLVHSTPSIPRSGNPDVSAEVGATFRHIGIAIKLIGVDCSMRVRLDKSRFHLGEEPFEDLAAGASAKFVTIRTQVLNDARRSIDLSCGHPVANHLTDERGRQFDAIDKLYLIPGNPGCGDKLQPGFASDMTWIYRVPLDANIAAFEFQDFTELLLGKVPTEPTRIPLTIPTPRPAG